MQDKSSACLPLQLLYPNYISQLSLASALAAYSHMHPIHDDVGIRHMVYPSGYTQDVVTCLKVLGKAMIV